MSTGAADEPPEATPPLLGSVRIVSLIAPVAAAAVLLLVGQPASLWSILLMSAILGWTVITSVDHAETLAHYLGEPFGTLLLALAVTIIETSLIVSIMLNGGDGVATLARDTVIAAVMITMNAIIGICLLLGGRRHHEQSYTQSGVSAALAMLSVLAVVTMVLPNFTTSMQGPYYTTSQLVFVAVVSVAIYATFVVAQTIRHRDYFIHHAPDAVDPHPHAPVTGRTAMVSMIVLPLALIGVVLLAKALSPQIESTVLSLGAPRTLVGIVIAALVLAPEGLAAVRAARANQVQTSLNLAIGSSLATIGLTIPAVSVASLAMGLHLELGVAPLGIVLLVLTLFIAQLTLATGRTTVIQGVLHLLIFAIYLFTTLVP